MRLSEKVLLMLSRDPGAQDYPESKEEHSVEKALEFLLRSFKKLQTDVAGKDVMDFGCGSGRQAVALAMIGARHVVGIDTDPDVLKSAQYLAKDYNVENMVEFREKVIKSDEDRFDIVLSHNAMEHYSDPISALTAMKKVVKKNGAILIAFGPPWFAPYGSHTHFFTKVPWVNILFSERTVMNVRKRFRSDSAMTYEEVKGGLNKMTLRRFEQIICACNLNTQEKKYRCVKGMDVFAHVPLVRELLVNHVSCVLIKE